MAEVAASVALVEAGAPAATPAPAAKTVEFGDGRTVSFVDGEASADPAAAILDEVLTGEPAEGDAPAEGEKPTEAKPADKPAEAKPEETPPPNDLEAAKLRKGFAKLAEERQKLVELQNAARVERATAQQYQAKAQKHDELIAAVTNDPAAFLLAHGGEALVQKALQGFIEMEKSPAEREIAKLRNEREQEKAEAKQRETAAQVEKWRNETIAKVAADERFDIVNSLGLQTKVIDVITAYYERHSQRNERGEVVAPAILSWDQAAQAVEDAHATALEKSKRYGKRAPVSAAETPKKDTPSAKPASAPAKKAPTSLSSVPVAETPAKEAELSLDPDERQAQILAEMGV